MTRFLRLARKSFDLVVIDAPPLLLVHAYADRPPEAVVARVGLLPSQENAWLLPSVGEPGRLRPAVMVSVIFSELLIRKSSLVIAFSVK